MDTNGTVCHPHVAGWSGCFKGEEHYRPNYTWPTLDVFGSSYTYPTLLFSGALLPRVAREIVEWSAANGGAWTVNSPRKSGGRPMICSFAQLGHAFGMLQADLVDRFLVFVFAVAAHGLSPGTWTAAECWGYDRSVPATGYAAPSQAILPVLVKWILVFEDPIAQTLWIGRALPRTWLAPGQQLEVLRVPTSFGRLSLALTAINESCVTASISLPELVRGGEHHAAATGFQWPTGGLRLRVRSPSFPLRRLVGVTLDGIAWPTFNASDESVTFDHPPSRLAALENIIVMFA